MSFNSSNLDLESFRAYLLSILKVLVVPAGYEQDVGSLPHVFDNQLRRFIGAHFVQQTYNWKNSIKKPTYIVTRYYSYSHLGT